MVRYSDRPFYALIPARKGSKGVPGKNRKLLQEKPLAVWTIDAALQANVFDRVVLSTDDDDLARIAQDAGADVPFRRPEELASDTASSLDVALHAADSLGWEDDAWLVLLQPTSPFRTGEDIRACIDILTKAGADACISVCPARIPLEWYKFLDEQNHLVRAVPDLISGSRRQDAQRHYVPNGAIYCIRISVLRETGSFTPPATTAYEMPVNRSIDIDEPLDFIVAESLLKAGSIRDSTTR
ncbi:MAG: cytidylyltransferase domain-containing protein [Hyphomicrobiales bacterium]